MGRSHSSIYYISLARGHAVTFDLLLVSRTHVTQSHRSEFTILELAKYRILTSCVEDDMLKHMAG